MMTSSPSKVGYKWWESDDKTKRLYTELLAEKIAKSPKKTPKTNSTLTRSLSSCSDLRSRIQALEHQDSLPGSPIKRSSSIRSLSSLEDTDMSQRGQGKKYTFETVTMETLAKYEYIKSPNKKSFGSKDSSSSSSSSSASLTSSPSPPTSGSDEEYEKKSFPMTKTYDAKTMTSRDTTSFHGDQKSEQKNTPWSWSNNSSKSNQERWSVSRSVSTSNTNKGKSSATPTKTCFSPNTSPRFSSFESDAWMKPNPMFMLMTSSQKPELKSFGLSDKSKAVAGASDKTDSNKEKFCRSNQKLDEVPEYKTSSSEDDVNGDGSTSIRAKNMRKPFKERQDPDSQNYSFKRAGISKEEISGNNDKDNKTKTRFLSSSEKKENSNDSKTIQEKGKVKFNPVDEVEGAIDIGQIAKRFQSLCEEVEQLEFKMFEFSDDIRKLKSGIGLKDDHTESENQTGQLKHHYKHAFTLAVGKDLLSERATARTLLMKQYSSPSKSPRSITKLLQDTGIDKEMAEADARKSQALEEELRKINEKDLTEDEIQEVLRSAKAKYIDRPNYLEDIGFSIRNQRKKG